MRNQNRILKNEFTLIKIIVVVVILTVLIAVAVPSVLKYMVKLMMRNIWHKHVGVFNNLTHLIKVALDANGLTQQDINDAMLEVTNNQGSHPMVHVVYSIHRDIGLTITPSAIE